jgi:hypothetical protein
MRRISTTYVQERRISANWSQGLRIICSTLYVDVMSKQWITHYRLSLRKKCFSRVSTDFTDIKSSSRFKKPCVFKLSQLFVSWMRVVRYKFYFGNASCVRKLTRFLNHIHRQWMRKLYKTVALEDWLFRSRQLVDKALLVLVAVSEHVNYAELSRRATVIDTTTENVRHRERGR